jgi:hypothetical protein
MPQERSVEEIISTLQGDFQTKFRGVRSSVKGDHFHWECAIWRHKRELFIPHYIRGLAYQKDGVPLPPTLEEVLSDFIDSVFSSEPFGNQSMMRLDLERITSEEEFKEIEDAFTNGRRYKEEKE